MYDPARTVRGPAVHDRLNAAMRSGRILPALLVVLLPQTGSAEIHAQQLEISQQQGSYRLNGEIRYTFNEEILRALESGVGLHLLTEARLYRERKWLWDQFITAKTIRHRLEYHVLSKQYQVTELEQSAYRNYSSLGGALADIGEIRDLPLFDTLQNVGPGKFTARIRFRLDLQALPPPLVPIAYVQKQWRLSSPWIEIPIDGTARTRPALDPHPSTRRPTAVR